MIIHVHVITLYIYYCCIKKFEDLSIFFVSNNWLLLLKEMEKEFFASDKVAELRQGVGKEEPAKVTRRLPIRKHEFEVNYINT